MSGAKRAGAPLVLVVVLSGASLFFGLLVAAWMSDLGGSDAAGNAISEGLAGLGLVALLVLLGALTLLGAAAGDVQGAVRIAAPAVVAIAFFSMWTAFGLLTRNQVPPGRLPLLIPAAAPPLIVAFWLVATVPPVRAFRPIAGWALLGVLLFVSLSVIPMQAVRDRADAAESARVADWKAKFDATPPDAPLWLWEPFLGSRVYLIEDGARTKMRALPSRQADATAMLRRDELPFGQLSQLDLRATPELCQSARESLSRRAAAMPAPGPNATYVQVADAVGGAADAVRWLTGNACSCDAEAKVWEDVARASGAASFEVDDFVAARDPKNLGATLYNDPPSADLLTEKSTLRAWLKFAYGPGGETPEAPAFVARARTLDHRTADAIAWLNEPNQTVEPFELIRFIPRLDLETTPALCAAALKPIRKDIADAYRPPANDPRPYRELPERLGVGNPLEALTWLASHGCAADAEVREADALVRTYSDSPERAAMLSGLTGAIAEPQ